MELKQLLKKVAAGETLTDEEKAFIANYDPDKAVSTGAAARQSAEAKLKEKEVELDKLKTDIAALQAEAEERANANKPEMEKLTHELEKLKKTVADKEAAFQTLEGEKRQLIRGGKLAKIMAGLKFVDGLDPEIPRMALEKALAAVDDAGLDSEDLVKPVLSKFMEANKAILADTSGHGGGNPPKDGPGGAGGLTMAKVKNMSSEEFLKQKEAIWKAEQNGTLK